MKKKKVKIVDDGQNITVKCKGFDGREGNVVIDELTEILQVTILNFLHKGLSMEELKKVLESLIKEYKGK